MIEFALETSLELVRKAYEGITGYAKGRYFFKDAMLKYLKNIQDDFGQVRVLGMKDPIALDSLYVRANVLEEISVRTGEYAEEMDKARNLYFRNFGKVKETVDGEELLNREEKLLVLGKPGAGKTTYLKYLLLRMATWKQDSRIREFRIPIFVSLHEYAKSGKTLPVFMADQFAYCGFEAAEYFLAALLENGSALILLDGLDEVSRETRLSDVIQEVINFTRQYRSNTFIISCRIAFYNHWFQQFKEVEIADFNKAQMEDFVVKYFQKEQETGAACWQKMQSNERLLEMGTSPLLLTLLCITYDERQDFPANRAMLYGRAMDALLNRWDASRRIQRDKLYKDLDEQHLLNLLSRIAAGYFEDNVYFFKEQDLAVSIDNFLINQFGTDARGKGARVLQDIEEHYGLIVRRSQYAFSFSHLTFMEYFTAQYIAEKALAGAVDELIEHHFGDERWTEVFILTTGKLGHGADAFLLKMQQKQQALIRTTPELNQLLKTVQSAMLPGKTTYTVIEREWFGIFLALTLALTLDLARDRGDRGDRVLERALVRVRVLERDLTRVLALARALDLDIDLDLASTRDLARVLAIDRVRELAHAHALAIDLLSSYSKENKFNLQIVEYTTTFLQQNIVIAKCLNSGATISAGVREQVLGNMFKPVV